MAVLSSPQAPLDLLKKHNSSAAPPLIQFNPRQLDMQNKNTANNLITRE